MYHIAIERKGHAKAGKAIGITRISHKRQVGMFGSSSYEGTSVFQTIKNLSQLEKKKKRKLSSYESGFEGRASIFFAL